MISAEEDFGVTDEGELQDPYGLWEHLCQTFAGESAANVSIQDRVRLVLRLQSAWNMRLNEAGFSKACTGWRAKACKGEPIRYDEYASRCNSYLCPSCHWHKQIACIEAIRTFGPKWKHLYLRDTGSEPCVGKIEPNLWRTFRAHNSSYHLIAWAVAPDSDEGAARNVPGYEREFDGEPLTDESNEVFPIRYKLVGVFGSNHEPRERGQLKTAPERDGFGRLTGRTKTWKTTPSVRNPKTGEVVGVVDRYSLYDVDEAVDRWLTAMSHPSLYTAHSTFVPAIVWSKQTLDRSFGLTLSDERGKNRVGTNPVSEPKKLLGWHV